MPGCSMAPAGACSNWARNAAANWSKNSPARPATSPGQVQNWPVPIVTDWRRPWAIESPRSARAPGSTNTGFTLPISAYIGIGSGRWHAASKRARPACKEPVNPTARAAACRTRRRLTSGDAPCTMENTPSCNPHASTARRMAAAAISEVPGCAGCALQTTGFLAANAEMVSPPGTENASGKLLAPKTTTGPSGTSIRRTSGFGSGLRSGSA